MKCPKCETETSGNYCFVCGTKLIKTPSETPYQSLYRWRKKFENSVFDCDSGTHQVVSSCYEAALVVVFGGRTSVADMRHRATWQDVDNIKNLTTLLYNSALIFLDN